MMNGSMMRFVDFDPDLYAIDMIEPVFVDEIHRTFADYECGWVYRPEDLPPDAEFLYVQGTYNEPTKWCWKRPRVVDEWITEELKWRWVE